MATWKKIIVSGSSAELSALKVDNLTSGSVVIGGGSTSNLGVRTINGTGNILATTGATGVSMTGSFSGSFSGTVEGGTVIGTVTAADTASKVTVTDTPTGTGPYYPLFSAGTSGAQSALLDSTTFTYNATTNTLNVTSSFATSASRASVADTATSTGTATTALTASRVANPLTLAEGFVAIAGTKVYDGSVATTIGIGQGTLISTSSVAVNVITSSLAVNQIVKMGNNALSGSNITDTGTQVQIAAGATSGLSVAAGGISVTGNSIFNNNVTVSGDLSVNGTTTFINTTNLYVKDRFLQIASGSNTLVDAGIVTQYNSSGEGSALYLNSFNNGVYGRWAIAYGVAGNTSTSVIPDEYVVSAKINQASAPTTVPPTWGSGSNGSGNMWITNAGDIYIYA
jgi:hypothetical protein